MFDVSNHRLCTAIWGITLIFGALGWYHLPFLHTIQYPLLAILVLLIGLPHGATDFLLFRRLQGSTLNTQQVFRFFCFYLTAVFGYFLIWLLLPALALVFFLVLSAYHFGQSNYHYLHLPRWVSFVSYMIWGAFILGTSLLWHWAESRGVILQLVKTLPAWPEAVLAAIPWVLLLVNIAWILGLHMIGLISQQQIGREIVHLAILSFMMFYTPLLVGFTIYFTLWHSLGSLLDQMAFFRRQWPNFSMLNYYRQATPYTVLAIIGLLLLFWGQSLLFSDTSFIAVFFILIACVTLPHIFLVEESHK